MFDTWMNLFTLRRNCERILHAVDVADIVADVVAAVAVAVALAVAVAVAVVDDTVLP